MYSKVQEMRVIFMKGERFQEIKRLSGEERAALTVQLLERALQRAKAVGAEHFYPLTCDLEDCINNYCALTGVFDENGDPL